MRNFQVIGQFLYINLAHKIVIIKDLYLILTLD